MIHASLLSFLSAVHFAVWPGLRPILLTLDSLNLELGSFEPLQFCLLVLASEAAWKTELLIASLLLSLDFLAENTPHDLFWGVNA